MDKILLTNCYTLYKTKLTIYNKMYEYYKGNTDAITNYKFVTDRANAKINTNFLKKFVKEEISYSVGNVINYLSKSSNVDILNDIDLNLSHWSENHDVDLMKTMLIHSEAYEIYYIGNESQFSSRIISPRNGFALTDDFGKVILFMHIFQLAFGTVTNYIDVYTDTDIIHYNESFSELGRDAHIFGVVPVGIAQLSPELEEDTLYKDIKGLQDSYETNLSDISNEISDFRNAYLAFVGVNIEETDLPKMKELGIIQIPTVGGKVEWLIKNINDSFIQNTLTTVEDKMYQLSSHINNNEKMQSNTSSLALRSRLISLEQKCKLNQGALEDCIKTRLKLLFVFLQFLKSKVYDYRDIKIKFTPNIPQDDTANANIIAQLGDKVSTETALSLFSFVENPVNEVKKIKEEQKSNSIGNSLLNPAVPPVKAVPDTVVVK